MEVLNQIVTGLPRDSAQEIRVLMATFQPGDRTVFHTHRRPVTVYVLAGAFTLEMEGRQTRHPPSGTGDGGADRCSHDGL